VINFVPGDPELISEIALASSELAGVHFTGSTAVFNGMWKTVGNNMGRYRNYPRLVGETGGKDFILAHSSAEAEPLAVAIVRGGFEFQGQKCSAASRVYVPTSLWPTVLGSAICMANMKLTAAAIRAASFLGRRPRSRSRLLGEQALVPLCEVWSSFPPSVRNRRCDSSAWAMAVSARRASTAAAGRRAEWHPAAPTSHARPSGP
jgi:hypothetical protein